MPDLFNHPIIYLRRLKTPTCKTCANYSIQFFSPACTCAKYLEHYNRLMSRLSHSPTRKMPRDARSLANHVKAF